ncbi:hypothetical protein [Clostridium sp.]|uniref:hypothetical protein n=1 Tax=Clostridium sp. TaxID=1506 RepID=UPI002848DB9F|nr:hypothetical protein [Clostridium sp.]MDR3593169.1 hypothetical protein [Clostridium sp.]
MEGVSFLGINIFQPFDCRVIFYKLILTIRHMKKIIDQRCDAYFVPDKEAIYAHSGPISLNY